MLVRNNTAEDRAITLINGPLFQVAYVTNDLDRAMEVFKARYGVPEFALLHHGANGEFQTTAALAWCGAMMFELIQAKGPGTEFYNNRLPTSEFAIKHHHLGFLCPSVDEWQAIKAIAVREELPIALEGENHSFKGLYVEATELGHYLEYIYANEQGLAFFDSLPRCDVDRK